MREIVTICLGQAGNSIGSKFNETVCVDHGIDPSGMYRGECELQLERIDCYFQEGICGKYVPRTLLVDLEPGTLEAIRGTRYGQTFRPDNFIFSKSGAGNNFAKGYYTEGVEMLESTFDAVRREAEASECLQGFQVVHSIGGGTGSGMGSLLLEMLKDNFSDRTIITWSVMPSPQISEVVVEPYNSILAAQHLIDTSSFSVCVDNTGLYDILRQRLRVAHPSYPDLNNLISLVMCGITAAFRFPGQLNADIRKFAVGLCPYPRLHFFLPGFAPLCARANQQYRSFSVPDLINEMFTGRNLYTSVDARCGKYITFAGVFRGMLSTRHVEELLYDRREKHSRYFAEWLPTNMKAAFCDIPPCGMKTCCSYLANTTVVARIWDRMVQSFQDMFKRKAFLHWYLGEGMEEADFTQAENSVLEMITEYQLQEVDGYYLPALNDDDVDEVTTTMIVEDEVEVDVV